MWRLRIDAVPVADRAGERINASQAGKVRCLLGIGQCRTRAAFGRRTIHSAYGAKLAFHGDPAIMRHLDNGPSQAHIFVEGEGGAIYHNRGKSGIDTRSHGLDIACMVKMKAHRNGCAAGQNAGDIDHRLRPVEANFRRCVNEHDGRPQLFSQFDNGLSGLSVAEVKCADCVMLLLSIAQQRG